MAATEKTLEDGQHNRRAVFVSWKLFSIAVVFIAVVAGAILLALRSHGSAVERGTRALVEAYSKQRLIEARLSGGLKCGRFDPASSGSADINTNQLELAQRLIADAVANGEPGAELAYGRLLASRSEKLAEAQIHLGRALALSPESAEAHNDMGVYFIQQGAIEDAINEFEAALKSKDGMPEALFNRALCYQQLLLKEPARADLTRLQSIEPDNQWLKEIEHRLERASAPPATQHSLAQVAAAFDAAIAEQRIDEAKKISDESAEMISIHAVWTLSLRQLKAAVAGNELEAETALSSLDLIGSVLRETRGNMLISDLARYLRELPEAERRPELELITTYVETVNRFVSNQSGDWLAKFQELQRRFRERGNYVFEALSVFQAANSSYAAKRFSDSIRLLKDVLVLVEQREWPYNRASILNLLALQTSRLGQDSLAIKYCEQALSLCKGSPQLESQILQYMSVPYWRLGDLDTALTRLRDSTRLYLENGQQSRLFANLAHNYSEIADIYRLRNKHTLSLLYAREALAYSIRASNLKYAAEYSSFIAIQHARLNQLEEAEAELKHALEYLRRIERGKERDYTEALVLTNAGEIAMRSGDFSRALGYYDSAKALTARGEGTTLATIDVLRGRAAAYTASGKGVNARADLMGAVGLIERYWSQIALSDQRSHFLDATHSVFDQLIYLDAAVLARQSEAFELSERARARTLLAEIGRDKRPNNSSDHDGSAGDPAVNRTPPQKVRALKLKDVQSYLDAESMVLEYSVTSKGTFLFLITHSGFNVVRSDVTAEILDPLVRGYISDLRRLAPENELNEKARALYDYLIKPVREEISRKANLWIVPDKALHFLPFGGLVDRSNDSYLIDSETLTVTYAPSASVLANCLSRGGSVKSSGPERILAVGNPLLNSEYFSNLLPLVDAAGEAKQSASVYAPGSVVLVGEQATEPKVRESIADCEVAHFALHCLVEDSSPWLAAMLLAGAKPVGGPSATGVGSADTQSDNARGVRAAANALTQEPTVDANDGLLYLNELYQIRLPRTRLVVLSACQSGLGQYYRGEGIVSLVRPLLAAGVPSVVASLWQVDSQATSDLMIAFHSQRKIANRRTGEALHDAQLKIRRTDRFRHPFYWAPFIAVGANN